MIFQNLNSMELIDLIIIFCHLCAILSFLCSALFFFLKSRNKKGQIRNYLLGIFIFLFLYGISRIIMFIFELTFDPFIWRLFPTEVDDFLNSDSNLMNRYNIFWFSATIMSFLGMTFFLYQLESFILNKKTKFILTIFLVITSFGGLLFQASGAGEITIGKWLIYLSAFPALFIPIIYFYFSYKSSGETRKRALMAGIGFLVLYLGISANTALAKAIFVISLGINGVYLAYILYGILTLVGLLIYLNSIKYE